MSFRCRTTKPCAMLWLLIAVADVALLLAGMGLTGTLLLLGAVATAALAVVAVRVATRHTHSAVAAPPSVGVRAARRAR